MDVRINILGMKQNMDLIKADLMQKLGHKQSSAAKRAFLHSVNMVEDKEGHSPPFWVSNRVRNRPLNGVPHSRLVRLVGTVGAGDITRKKKASGNISGVYRHHYKARSSAAAPTSLQSDAPR